MRNLPQINTREIRQQAGELQSRAGAYLRETRQRAQDEDWNLFGSILKGWYKTTYFFFGRARSRAYTSAYAVAKVLLYCLVAGLFIRQTIINMPFIAADIAALTANYPTILAPALNYLFSPLMDWTGFDVDFYWLEKGIVKYSLLIGIPFVSVLAVLNFDMLSRDLFSWSKWRNRTLQNITILILAVAVNVAYEGYTLYNLGKKKGNDVYSAISEEDQRRENNIKRLREKIETLEGKIKPFEDNIKQLQADLSGKKGLRARVGWYEAGTPAYKDAVDIRDRTIAQVNADKDAIDALNQKIETERSKISELESTTEQLAQTAEFYGNLEGAGMGVLIFLALLFAGWIKTDTVYDDHPQLAQTQAEARTIPEQTHERPAVHRTNEPRTNEQTNVNTVHEHERTNTNEPASSHELSGHTAHYVIRNHTSAHAKMVALNDGRIDRPKKEVFREISQLLGIPQGTVKRVFYENYQERPSS